MKDRRCQLAGNFEQLIFDLPVLGKVSESEPIYNRNPIKINYLEREQRNRNLGDFGEELVIEYEKWNLIRNGKEKNTYENCT